MLPGERCSHSDLTPQEIRALRLVLDRVAQIVANNSQTWTSRWALPVLKNAWTEDAKSARTKLSKRSAV